MTNYSAAVISPDGLYRYELIRRWSNDPMIEFIMLNPSTADGQQDDPTIRRCISFATRWGYGAIVVRNLYAYRATDPLELVNVEDPVGPQNRAYLGNAIGLCTIAAWGANPAAVGWWNGYPFGWQPSAIKRKQLLCLGVTSSGAPRHPLYVRGDTTPVPWDAAAFLTGQPQERV